MSTLSNPMHPGLFLKKAYLEPLNLNVTEMAKKLGVSKSSVSRLVSGKSDLSYSMAIRLSDLFSRKAESWMKLQTAYGLAKARKELNIL